MGIIPARATYFWAYSTSKGALTPSLGDGTLTHILSGIAAVGAGRLPFVVWLRSLVRSLARSLAVYEERSSVWGDQEQGWSAIPVTHIYTHTKPYHTQGVTGNTITNPIWMVKTRMQLLADGAAGQKAYTGYRDAITRIYRCVTWRGLRCNLRFPPCHSLTLAT